MTGTAPPRKRRDRPPIARPSMLTLDEELALVDAMRAGTSPHGLSADGRAARDHLVLAHLPLVRRLARSYAGPTGVLFDDLVQVGAIGLIDAARLFPDHGRGRFSAYASWRVTSAMGRLNASEAFAATVPSRTASRALQVKRLRANARAKGETVTVSEMAGWLGIDEDLVREADRILHPTVSMSTPIGLSGVELGDTLYRKSESVSSAELGGVRLGHAHLIEVVRRALPALEAEVVLRRHEVIVGREGATISFKDIGSELGVSGEGARQAYKRGLQRLREDLDGERELRALRGLFVSETTLADDVAGGFKP